MPSESGWQATERVLGHVKRARESLALVAEKQVNADGKFHHPATQLAALKAAREHIEKAIAQLERKAVK